MFNLLPRSLISGTTLRTTTQLNRAVVEAKKLAKHDETREYHEVVGDILTPSQIMGIDHLRDPRLNKGLGFTLEERQALGIHGLQPARFKSQEEQVQLCKMSVENYQEPLNKYLYLTELHDRNEKLFFRLLTENIEQLMPIVYTPTVGLACQRFGLIYRRPHGLFITINDKGHIYDVLKNWPEPDVKAIVVTDGERILGLGDLGACGMGIPIGKLALYTALARIKPHHCLPISLDVGTDNEALLEDPTYVGLRQKRARGKEYDEFLDEFMAAVVHRYGQDTLIQFEDFGNANAFRLLEKYRLKYCTFNDDIQGTASVSLAGLLASNRRTGKKISDHTFLFFGAGGAALGISDLCVKAMEREGLSTADANNKIWMIDVDGLVTKGRSNLQGHQVNYAKDHEPEKDFLKLVNEIKPSVLIGASAQAGAFTPEVLKAMASYNDLPIVFALSNPTIKAECTAQQAYDHTDGRVIFCSGSPFPKVEFKGKTYTPGQGNNAYIFPGVALGVITAGIHHVSDDYFIIAAKTVAEHVLQEHLEQGSLYPPLKEIPECSLEIAYRIMSEAYKTGQATVYPEPKDKKAFVESKLYSHFYEDSLPKTWTWPKNTEVRTKPLQPKTKITIS